MKTTNLRLIAALVAILVAALFGAGCGGGSDGGSAVQTTPISLAIQWPDRTRTITPPASALSMRILVIGAAVGGGNVEILANRGNNNTAHLETYTSGQPGVLGTWMVEVRFYSEANQGGSVVGASDFQTSIAADGKIQTIVTVDSKVATVEVAANQHVWFHSPKNLVATAFDAEFHALVLPPDSIKWTVTAGASHLLITDGKAEGLLEGPAEVVATVDGKASPATDVEVRATALRIALPESTPASPFPYYYSVLSKDGMTVGGVGIDDSNINGIWLPIRWTEASGLELLSNFPPDVQNRADTYAINADGTVLAGNRKRQDTGGKPGWVWSNGVVTELTPSEPTATVTPSGISANGAVICGQEMGASGGRAFTSTPQGPISFLELSPNTTESSAIRISADGTRIAGAQKIGGFWRATLWVNGAPQMLGTEEGKDSWATRISGDGQVIFGLYDLSFQTEAFRWTSAAGVVKIGAGTTFRPGDTNQSGDLAVGSTAQGVGYAWTTAHGLETLPNYVAREYGLIVTAEAVRGPSGLSANGKTILASSTFNWLIRPALVD